MSEIIRLDPILANQIAAGEVVERPLSVVKELVENALDAGATRIKVSLVNGGLDLIEVSDNGKGMSKEDLELSIEKYTTSKITSLQDLYEVMTFGFRGEALASISSVSKLTIVSKTKNTLQAFKLTFDGQAGKKIVDAMGEEGTTVSVASLFFNTPARLNYLKSPKTEYAKIHEFLHSISLSYPSVSFSLNHDQKEVFFKPANQDLKTRLYTLYGDDFVASMKEISIEAVGMKLTGYISDPKVSYGNKNRQYFFVNHRMVFSPIVARAMMDAYLRFIPHGTFPAYVLFLDIDPTTIDVNVHPRKLEIRFENESQVFRLVLQSVQSVLEKTTLVQTDEVSEALPSFSPSLTNDSPPSYHTGKGSLFAPYSPYKNLAPNPSQTTIQESVAFSKEVLKPQEGFLPESLDLHETKLGRIIGQCYQSYILVEHNKKIVIYDQHALAERILYERLISCSHPPRPQRLLLPLSLTLQASEYEILERYKQIFESMGFEIELLGHRLVTLGAVPDFVKREKLQDVFLGILGDLAEGNTLKSKTLDEIRNKIFATSACRSAIKFGHKLNLFEMHALLNDASQGYSSTCPHGRPVVFDLDLETLKTRYER